MKDTSRRDVLKAITVGTVATVGVGSAPAMGAGCSTGEGRGHGTLFSAGVLSGDQEVPPVETDATGAAVFRFADHGEGPHLHYALLVARIENVTQAHIHLGERGENGDVVAFLFGAEDENGEFVGPLEQGVTENGILAVGSITAEDLVGPLEGEDLEALAEEMKAENAYVNVHTEQNPPGEIRGQIEAVDEEEVAFEERVQVKGTKDDLKVVERVKLKVGGEEVLPMDDGRDGDGMDDDGDDGADDDGTADQGSGDA
ncbi:CHRD domain-containing protein [Halegenticoccus soli]|uniref:CHRD domain-containing protein n=1 Tax=Halegenticoccus soli TaxID=1985678 RepID=UPI0018EBE591|nr:CHRD domain-containing protein [Halegenticoccus soli]